MSLNQVNLIGYLGQDPEKRVTPQWKEVYTLSLATSYSKKLDDGTKKTFTEWHKITVFNQINFMQYLHQGDLVFVRGRLHYTQNEVNGVKRYFTQILCDEIQKLSKDEQPEQPTQAQAQQQPIQEHDPFDDCEIPF